jgi:hypothetical protein
MNLVAEKSEKSEKSDKYVDEDRAAFLLGLSVVELRRLSAETGFGQSKSENGAEQRVFTYAELYRLCRLAVQMQSTG